VLDALTFGAAAVGWGLLTLLLAATVLRGSALARVRPYLTVATGAVVACHAVLGWHHRFGWDPSRAWQKGALVFVSFHAALALVVLLGLRPTAPGRIPWLVVPAWLLVAPGATGAPFRYDLPPGVGPVVLATTAAGPLVGVLALARRAGVSGGRPR
jgi:hypothetical protein